MKILELYSTFRVAKHFYPDDDIEGKSVTPILEGIKDETYDHIIAAHVLQYYSYLDSQIILKEWARTLKPGGTLILITPSLEWVAEQILSEEPSPATLPILFGSHIDNRMNFSGFTMRSLRRLFDGMGMHVTHARTGTFDYGYNDKRVEVEQHLVIGKKGGSNGEKVDSESDKKTGRASQTTRNKTRKRHPAKNASEGSQEGRQVG